MPWTPLITQQSTQESIYSKLYEIKEELLANPTAIGQENLFGGDLGVSLFFFYYYKLTQDEQNLNIAAALMGNAYDGLENNPSPHFSFASGVSGLCWATEFVRASDFMEVDTAEIFPDIDPIVSNYMLGEMQRGNYDYMHGSLGAALYFLKKNFNPTIHENITAIIEQLSMMDDNGKQKWNYHYKEGQLEECTNLGLSHGIPSILVVLLKAYKLHINPEKSKNLLDGIVAYLLDHVQDPTIHKAYYAYAISEADTEIDRDTRLAWCYGDLGVCCALWQVAQAFDDTGLKEKVLEIMTYTAKRRDLEENRVCDAGLCHGAAGIAHIFNRFYQDTHNEIFKDAALFWYQQTLSMATFSDGLAGYKAWVGNATQEHTYEKCTGLLEGIAGIGLALIGAVADFEPSWDECLLIS
ncbi:MAG: lanthionine synthetase C family protein [Sphingobacteriaceae bacterium]